MEGEERFQTRSEISTIVLGVVMLALPLTFFYLLSVNVQFSPGGDTLTFGFKEIMFSILVALIGTGFLRWLRYFMRKSNAYLGLVIGILALIAFQYSLFTLYVGPYTNTFAIIVALTVLIYLGIFFFKFRGNTSEELPSMERIPN